MQAAHARANRVCEGQAGCDKTRPQGHFSSSTHLAKKAVRLSGKSGRAGTFLRGVEHEAGVKQQVRACIENIQRLLRQLTSCVRSCTWCCAFVGAEGGGSSAAPFSIQKVSCHLCTHTNNANEKYYKKAMSFCALCIGA